MYSSFYPRLGVLHFTLAMVFVPFGAPQAESVARPAPLVAVAPMTAAEAPALLAAMKSFSCGTPQRDDDALASRARFELLLRAF